MPDEASANVNPLEDVSLQQLVEEIRRRSDAYVLVAVRRHTPFDDEDPGEHLMFWTSDSYTTCIGLVELAKQALLTHNIPLPLGGESEWNNNEEPPDDEDETSNPVV